MTSDNKDKAPSKKSKDINEIEIEQKDLLNVFFDKSNSQFESQFFLSRKRMLNAENGQTELSELLKSKLKALDMMLLILTNNKNILKESDLSCCEVLNNLLSISKKDKSYGEHIYSKIKSIILYLLKNQLFIKEKNIESNKVIIKFLITLLNIKFDNGYFKQILEIISTNEEISKLFINELFDKLFKGRNITIKLKEMKYILKTLLFDEKIKKFYDFFDILEKILSFVHEKDSGGCRTTFQLNQVVFLLQYLIDILNIKEIKNALPEKNKINEKLLQILNNIIISLNELIDKKDFEKDTTKMKKKELEALNEKIRRKKIFFTEMYNFYNKFKNYFQNEIKENKEYTQKIEEINNLYKNTIAIKYTVVINTNTNNKKDKKNKNKDKKDNKDKDKNKDKNNDKNNKENKENKEEDMEVEENNIKENEKEDKDDDKNDDNEKEEDEKNIDNDDKDDNDENNKDDENDDNDENNKDDENDENENKNKNKGIELDEEDEENKINNKNNSKKNKKNNMKKKKNKQSKESKQNKENKKSKENKQTKENKKNEKKEKEKEKEKKSNKNTKKENKNKKKKEQ